MTVYGPATGNYSRDSILAARKSNGKKGTRILDVDKTTGKAPSGARVGDYVRTAGGSFQIIGGTEGNWETAKEGTPGYGSITDSVDGRRSYSVNDIKKINRSGFDTDAIMQAQIKARNALLEQQYNTDLNNLNKNYNTNLTNAESTKASVQQDYLNRVEGLKQNTYNELQRSKEFGVQRGITNSALGRAQDQTMLRAGSTAVDSATTERNRVITEISNKINDLTAAFGSDKATLDSNLGQAKLQAMSEAELAKLNADLQLYQKQVDWANQFKMTDINFNNNVSLAKLQNQFQVDLSKLNFSQQKELQSLSASAQEKLARMSQGASMAQFNANLAAVAKQDAIENGVAIFSQQFLPNMSTYNKSQQAKVYSLLNQLGNGQISYMNAVEAMGGLTTYSGSNVADFKQY